MSKFLKKFKDYEKIAENNPNNRNVQKKLRELKKEHRKLKNAERY